MIEKDMLGIVKAVEVAWWAAVAAGIVHKNKAVQNSRRSQMFVRGIRSGIEEVFAGPAYAGRRIAVLSKGVTSVVPGLTIKQELLYDVHAFEYEVAGSPGGNADICIMKKSLVQLESELQNDVKEITTDFDKLVNGKSEVKVMVMPAVKIRRAETMDLMRRIALNIDEPLFLIQVPYPKEWDSSNPVVMDGLRSFQFDRDEGNGVWKSLGGILAPSVVL